MSILDMVRWGVWEKIVVEIGALFIQFDPMYVTNIDNVGVEMLFEQMEAL